MDTHHGGTDVPITKFKRTKIIATLGPATNTYDSVVELIKAGANAFRLNFSHGAYEERKDQIKWVRKASKELKKPIAIIADLQGPKVRLGDFDDIVNVRKGQILTFQYKADLERSGHIPLQYDLSKKVKSGDRLYVFDGKVKTHVTKVDEGVIHALAENEGILVSRKGINVPDTDFEGDIITKKDNKDLAFICENDIDYVALSFVQHADDIKRLKKKLRNLSFNARVIAKIETKSAVANLEEIVKEADSIMIARGDLAVETEPESVPVVQRQIIGLGHKYAKPTIVATQMLASMTEREEPTRAEVSDVATAAIVGADAVMLSDETANGKFPIIATQMMKRIVTYAEINSPLKAVFIDNAEKITKQSAICRAAIKLAEDVGASSIVAETKSGATALQIASNRPNKPILAVTASVRVANQLAIVYGVKSYIRPDDKMQATKLTNWLQQARVLKSGDVIVTASGRHPGVVGTTDTIKVRVLK